MSVALILPLGMMTAVQALATMSVLALATVAPAVALSMGVGAELVGYQVSLIYIAAALVSALAGSVVRRFGAGSATLIAVLAGLSGLMGVVAGDLFGGIWMVALASLLLGIGYGLTNPAASHILSHFTPPRWRNLIYSIKQTGVPIGGAIAGLALPALSALAGWRGAVTVMGGVFLVMVVALLPHRSRWDHDRQPDTPLRGTLTAGPRLVWSMPALRSLALMALCFSAIQLSLMTFAVSFLVRDLHWSLVAAGGAVALVQAAGAVGRIVWGLLADRWLSGRRVLLGLGLLTAAAALAATQVDPHWSAFPILAILVCFGASAIGWNGVFLAEVSRMAPKGLVGAATGGALMFTFCGVVIGPALFAALFSLTGSYAHTFGWMAVFPLVGAGLLVHGKGRGNG